MIRAVFGILLAALLASAQAPGGLARFDTISILTAGPYVPGQPLSGSTGSADQGHITYVRRSLVSLLAQAYDVAVDQLVVPDWMYDTSAPGTYSYNISVTMPRDQSEQQIQLMMQNLLVDRFHLTLHHEMRSFPRFELIVAAGGPRLDEATSSRYAVRGREGGGVIRQQANGETMARFAASLGPMITKSNGGVLGTLMPCVVDKTGLTGSYGFTWAFRGRTIIPGALPDSAREAWVDPDAGNLPDIFAALRTQLGLQLMKVADVPLDVLVIDQADMIPAAN